MTGEEIAALLNSLEQGLIEQGLLPLVNQERIAASEGKAEEPAESDIEFVREEWAQRGLKRPSRPRSGDVRIRPLSASERFAQLLDLLEVAIGGSYAIETRLRGDINAALSESYDQGIGHTWSGQISFYDPLDSDFGAGFRADHNMPDQKTLEQRREAVRRVVSIIDQLRSEAGVPRSDYLHRENVDEIDNFDEEFPGEWS